MIVSLWLQVIWRSEYLGFQKAALLNQVDIEPQADRPLPVTRRRVRYNSVGVRVHAAVVVGLLFAVAALSTAAKDGLYFPRTSIARHASDSTKMMPSQASAVFLCEREVLAKSHPLRPARQTLAILPAIAPTNQIGVVVSMQHRSPPLFSTL